MGEVELVEAGGSHQYSNNNATTIVGGGGEQHHEFAEFLSTNRAGRRNALSHVVMTADQMILLAPHHEDLSVTCLAQKLQQMNTAVVGGEHQPSTSGYSPFGGGNPGYHQAPVPR